MKRVRLVRLVSVIFFAKALALLVTAYIITSNRDEHTNGVNNENSN